VLDHTSQKQLIFPLLAVLNENGPMKARDAADAVAERIGLEPEQRNVRIPNGRSSINAFDRDVRWAEQKARARDLTTRSDDGNWHLTRQAQDTLTPATPGIIVTIYESDRGIVLWSEVEAVEGLIEPKSISLLLTSPPYDIQTAKQYGGRRGREYEEWLVERAAAWKTLLAEDGSIMLNLGDTWLPNTPALSLYQERILIRLVDELGYSLNQRLAWHNPAKLPAPAAFVTVKRIRVTPALENIYWLSLSPERSYANNANVLRPYSEAMKRTLAAGQTNVGERPSGYTMNEKSFAIDNGGSIPHNLISASNTRSNDPYSAACREQNLPIHPARFPEELARFCIGLTTERDDIVWDPFGGSLTTFATAIAMGRRAISNDRIREYLHGGLARLDTAPTLF
jgi:site-specific DNA-methyltransferase (cytosine-N4-specific)